MYITGSYIDLISRLNQLPTGINDLVQFTAEANGYEAANLFTSGHLVQTDYLLRLKYFQFSLSGALLAQSILY
jgi:hypothetical protein